MIYIHLSNFLVEPGNPDWDVLLKKTFNQEIHPNRKMGFLLSREALRVALEDLGHSPAIVELDIWNFNSLLRYPRYTLAISHTPSLGAVIIGDRSKYISLGIDVEADNRIVKDAIIERISHPEDEKFSNLQCWCIKEACFKTLMNSGLFEKPIEFSSIKITRGKWHHLTTKVSGSWDLKPYPGFVVAQAYLEN